MTHCFEPTYLGVKLDRSLTYNPHVTKLRKKLTTRNNLLRKLAGTSWGATASCLRTTALALVYSCAEYCSESWLQSSHAAKVDVELNKTMRIITGTVKSTPIEWLPALSDILPPHVRRQNNLLKLYRKALANEDIPLNKDLATIIPVRLKSRCPVSTVALRLHSIDFNPKEVWKEHWLNSGHYSPIFSFDNHAATSDQFKLHRKLWCNMNRLRTGHGRCNAMLYKWKVINDPGCECGAQLQTMNHLMSECPLSKYAGNVKELLELTSQAISWLQSLRL